MYVYPNKHEFKVSPLSEAKTITEITVHQLSYLLSQLNRQQLAECIELHNKHATKDCIKDSKTMQTRLCIVNTSFRHDK